MPGPAKVIIVEADPAANAALRFGLSRAGLAVATAVDPVDVATEAGSAGLVLISNGAARSSARNGNGSGHGSASLVRAIRAELDEAALLTPILFVGAADDGGEEEGENSRYAVERAGAAEVLLGPQALRDIANVARVMLGDRRSEGWGGTLAEISGVFGLVRALAALGRSGVLTLTRGVRRGEVRYYHGEITSAQVGMIHGQAAFHQLLLWIDAKFEFRGELVVRRQQIPLTPEELLADAERFLEGTRDIAGGLSPSVVLDVVADRMAALAIKIPTEVHGILNMFDGRRTLVDILEDSPYRVHDTLRVARKGFESKVLRSVPPHKPRPTWRAVVPLEEWLLGAQPMVPRELRPVVIAGISDGETIKMEKLELEVSGSVGAAAAAAYDVTEKNAPRDRSERNGVPPGRGDIGSLDWADLVPRSSGLEIPMLSPIVPAAKANGEIDVADGDGAAAAKIAVGRTVIVSEDAIISPEERAEEERLVEARKQAEREAIAKAADEVRAAKAKEAAAVKAAEAAKAEDAAAKAKEAADKAAEEVAAKEAAAKEAAAKARAAAEREAAAEQLAAEKAASEKAAAEKAAAEKLAAEQAEAEKAASEKAAAEKAAAEKLAVEQAEAEQAASEKAAAEKAAVERAEAEKAAAEKAAVEKAAAEKAAEQAAAETVAAEHAAVAKAAQEPREPEAAAKASAQRADGEQAGQQAAALAAARAQQLAEEEERLENERTSKINRRPTTADVLPKSSGKKRDRKKDRGKGTPIVDPQAAKPTAAGSVSSGATSDAPRESQPELSATTAKLRAQATPENAHGKPGRASTAPVAEESSALAADLRSAHSAASAHAKAQAAAASSPDAGGRYDAVVQEVKRDASKATAAFTADEEAFFQAGGHHHAAVETFADLDDGYRPRTFWQRLLGRGKSGR